jgi:hypothetical protein
MEKPVRITREFGQDIGTPDDTRSILGLKGKDKVSFQ